MLVDSLMRRRLVVIDASASVRELARHMQAQDTSGVIVVRGGAPVGIVTERDVVRRVVAEGRDADATRVQDVMSTPLATIEPSATVEDAAARMASLRVKRLVVVLRGGMVGILSATDIAYREPELVRRFGANADEPDWR